MASIGAMNATMRRLFPLTLSDQAHMWFTLLTPYSVDTFEQLAKLFMNHFSTMAPRSTTMQRLVNTKQGDNESDRAYIERIDKLILEGEPLGNEAKLLGR